jgi:hypothetical protein
MIAVFVFQIDECTGTQSHSAAYSPQKFFVFGKPVSGTAAVRLGPVIFV